MQHNIKDDMTIVQTLVFEAYKTTGRVMAMLDNQVDTPAAYTTALELLPAQFEEAAVAVRALCDRRDQREPPEPPDRRVQRGTPGRRDRVFNLSKRRVRAPRWQPARWTQTISTGGRISGWV